MKRFAVVLSLLLLVFVVSVRTQTQAPTPPPEMKALEVFNGEWTYEGEAKESPLGPSGKCSGKMTVQLILNGFFQEYRIVEKGNLGDREIIQIDWYDAATKSYFYQGFISNGDSYSGSGPIIENVWKWFTTITHDGIQYKIKGVHSIAADGLSFLNKTELSTDGKTWMPWYDIKNNKVKPAE